MITKSGSRAAGATLYCKRVFVHPFTGFEIILAVRYVSARLPR